MAKYFGATPFRDLLTHSIASDATMKAAADALDSVLARSARSIPDVLLFARLANDCGFATPLPMLGPLTRLADLSGGLAELPEGILDMLAWQLHVEGYEAAVDVQAKRELIQGSLLLHRRKGTPWAVRNALQTALALPADVSEWFSYGGEPYFFRVGLDVTGAEFTPAMAANAFRLILEYKNVRSWLDYLITRNTTPLDIRTGLAVTGCSAARCHLYFAPPAPAILHERRGLAVCGMSSARLVLHFHRPRPAALRRRISLAASGMTTSRIITVEGANG